ncbi:recombination regulator RecX [Pseudonocardia sp. H11422]|uniref:recombination regulator RecX n=1 Tax=Pseudonocardia sp. H11422 TaxID=2835866 RepID=UPI001BDD45BA|nr:recombination regulator RecX [Pseudonocardia sp. H11422]
MAGPEERPGDRAGPDSGRAEQRAAVRVARLEDLGPAGERDRTAVAHLDDVGKSGSGSRAVAELDDLAPADGSGPAPVALFDTLDLARERRPATRTARLDAAPVADRRRSRADSTAGDRTAGDRNTEGRTTRRRSGRSRGRSSAGGRAGAADVPQDESIPEDPPTEHPTSEPPAGRPTGRLRRRSGEARERSGKAPVEPEQDADPESVARSICLRLLTDRARTRQELAQALRKRGVPDDVAARVLDRFGEVGLIDDAAFAGQWVHSRHTFRGLGRRAIAVELRRKGVDDETAADALAEVDSEAEEQRARELVERKLRTQRGEIDQAAARRLLGMLARKGYPAGVAYRVVKEALAEHAAELAEQMPSGEDG